MQAYLDNSATTRVSEGVIQEMARAMREMYFNPSSLYAQALSAEKELNECRALIQKELRAKDARVIFVRRYWYLNSCREIADAYRMSESKVRVTLTRTRRKLKAFLEKEDAI